MGMVSEVHMPDNVMILHAAMESPEQVIRFRHAGEDFKRFAMHANIQRKYISAFVKGHDHRNDCHGFREIRRVGYLFTHNGPPFVDVKSIIRMYVRKVKRENKETHNDAYSRIHNRFHRRCGCSDVLGIACGGEERE